MTTRKLLSLLLSLSLLLTVCSAGMTAAWAAARETAPDWSKATPAVLGEYQPADALPPDSLIAGMIPTKDTNGGIWRVNGGKLAWLTDGELIKEDNSNRVMLELRFGSSKVEPNDWCNFTFSLGKRATITHFLVGSEVGADQYLKNVRIYVSETLETLYDAENRIVEASGVTAGNYLCRGAAAVGAYVGFSFLYPGAGAPWYGQIRLGELAVYGTPETRLEAMQRCVTGATVTELTTPPAEKSIIEGKTPVNAVQLFNRNATAATDGKFQGLDAPIQAVLGEDGRTRNYNDAHPEYGILTDSETSRTVYYTSADYLDLIYYMGAKSTVESFAIGSTAEDTGITKAEADKLLQDTDDGVDASALTEYLRNHMSEYVRLHKAALYVGNSPDLMQEENRVAAYEYCPTDKPAKNSGALTPLAGLYTLDTPATGRYIGFRIYCGDPISGNTAGKWGWHNQVRIGELAVYGTAGDPTEDLDWAQATATVKGSYLPALGVAKNSLLSGRLPTQGTDRKSWKVIEGSLSLITDGQLILPDDSNRLVVDMRNGVVPAGEWAQFTFDSGVIADFTHFLIGSEAGVHQRLKEVRIYVSATSDGLYDDANLVAEAADVAYGNYFLRGDTHSGRYVGFAFRNPGKDTEPHWYGQIRLGELAAYGSVTDPAPDGMLPHRLTSRADAAQLPDGDNLLKGLPVRQESGATLPVTDAGLATDGIIPGITQESTPAAGMHYPADTSAQTLVYDLGVNAQLTHLLVASGGGEDAGQQLKQVQLYISETLPTLYEETAFTVAFSGAPAVVLEFTRSFAGRYIGLRLTAQEPTAPLLIGEVGAYGALLDDPTQRVDLIAGKLPVDSYICEVGMPDRYHDAPGGYLSEPFWTDDARFLTDGDYSTRSAWAQRTTGRLPTLEERYYISPETPWMVLVYHLGGTATVEEILLTSENYGYFLGGADFYVGQTLDTLFQAENRVYATGGEQTIRDGETIRLDPSTDILTRCMRAVLEIPKEGRYVAIVVTRPTSSVKLGYSVGRVDAINVYGKLPADRVDPERKTTFTDSVYGYTLTLNPLHYDDTALFDTLDHLEVVRAAYPDTLPHLVCDNWLTVDPADPYIYEFRLIRKDGQQLTESACGARTWNVQIPNDTGHMQGLGTVTGDTVSRVVNSRTDASGTLIGEQLTSFRVLKLVFDPDGVIYSGVAGTDRAGSVAGAAIRHRLSPSLWALGALLPAVAALWCIQRRKKGRIAP